MPEHALHKKWSFPLRISINVCEKDKNKIVGYLLMEISQVTKLLLDGGANVSA